MKYKNFFKNYIKENKFSKAPILTYKHYYGKFDLLVNQGNAEFRTFIIPHNRWLSFSKLNNNEIILNIELNHEK